MKTILKIGVVAISLVLMLVTDVPLLPVRLLTVQQELVPEADAIMGRQRRTRRRGVVVGYNAGKAAASSAASQQQAAPAEQQPATAQQQAPAPAPTPPPPANTGQPLPLGTVVSALPAGCVSTPVGGVEYYYCGGNFYRAAFQGNKLVYVTTKPE
jgi:hypothetical protein